MKFRYRISFLTVLVSLVIFSSIALSSAGKSLPKYEDWKFAVISDTQNDRHSKSCVNNEVLKTIADYVVQEKPDFILVSGDLVNGWHRNSGTAYDAQYVEWKRIMGSVYQAGIRVYPIRGNHDDGPERLALPPLPARMEPPPDSQVRIKAAFRKTFNESYIPQNGPEEEKSLTYSFIHKNVFVIGLDQYTGCQHKVNQAWLDRQLANNKSPYIFVFGHEPAFGIFHKDNLAFFPKDRDAFWDSLGNAGVKIYFCGHDHIYNRAKIADSKGRVIRQIIVSSGGGSLRKWSGKYANEKRVKGEYSNCDYHGYIIVAVDAEKITVAWKALTKWPEKSLRILDEFTIEK